MSQENVELVFRRRRLQPARLGAFPALMHPDCEVESRLVVMEGGYHGHDGVRRWWNDFLGTFPDYTIEIEEVRDLGDVTLVHSRGWGTARPAIRHSSTRSGSRSDGLTASASGGATAQPRKRLSKPPGFRSRRCRRRTWRSCVTRSSLGGATPTQSAEFYAPDIEWDQSRRTRSSTCRTGHGAR